MFNKDEFFHKATLLICSSFQIELALYRTYVYLRRHIPADCLYLGILSCSGHRVEVIAKAGLSGGKACTYAVPLSTAARQTVRKWPDSGNGTVIKTSAESPVFRDWNRFHGRSRTSHLAMLLKQENGGFGFLMIEVRREKALHAVDINRLALLRKPFEIALANALKNQGKGDPSASVIPAEPGARIQPATFGGTEIIGGNTGLQDVMTLARSVAGVHTPVLLLGETGVGKEVIADAIHSLSQRSASPMIKVNCGAIPTSLIDSELFGHEKGAFTGALRRRPGRFERAHGGTILLDEIGELPQEAQVKLLRVLQSGEIERIGGTEVVPTDIRLIAATHRNLEDMVSSGTFRRDLWFRINVFPIHIPPLRHRPEDIPMLVPHLVKRKCLDLGLIDVPEVSLQEVKRLRGYDWPGNVRELENMIERALLLTRGVALSFCGLVPNGPSAAPLIDSGTGERVTRSLNEVMSNHIRNVLRQTNGRIDGPRGAARLLELKPSTLRSRMIKLGIPFIHKGRTFQQNRPAIGESPDRASRE